MDDNLLLIGLQEFGGRNITAIKNSWLPRKETIEIKHRFKNLTCARVPINHIKRWKLCHSRPLGDSEVKILAVALRWFGFRSNRWKLISKLFLPNRSPYLLELEFTNILADRKKSDYLATLMLNAARPEEFLQSIIRQEDSFQEISEDPCCFDI